MDNKTPSTPPFSPNKPVFYHDYLQLDKILGAQKCQSEDYGRPCHDETLFIITHQAYELWFKQIHHELDYILDLFSKNFIPERELGTVVSRLKRIVEIQKILVAQFNILETMTPLDFLDFRDYLIPASGFQSIQFRALEMKLGYSLAQRGFQTQQFFLERLNPKDKDTLLNLEKKEGLLLLIGKWLERIPFLTFNKYNFWEQYRHAVDLMLAKDLAIIESNETMEEKEKDFQKTELDRTRKTFESLLNAEIHSQLVQKGTRRLSQKATLAALFILLYRDEPMLHLPFKLLTEMMNIDELLASWKYRHSIMAHRMLGTKIGTGGSAGHLYLKNAAEKGRIFEDLYNLTTFLLPRSILPKLPSEIEKQLGFFFSSLSSTLAPN